MVRHSGEDGAFHEDAKAALAEECDQAAAVTLEPFQAEYGPQALDVEDRALSLLVSGQEEDLPGEAVAGAL